MTKPSTTSRIHLVSLSLFAGTMLLSASGNLLRLQAFADNLRALGYPHYLLDVLGTAKLLGVLALAAGRRTPRLQEWAYAGFTFELGGAFVSQLLAGTALRSVLAPLLCWSLLVVAYLTAPQRWLKKPAESEPHPC